MIAVFRLFMVADLDKINYFRQAMEMNPVLNDT